MKDYQKEITPLAFDDLFIVLNHHAAKFDYPVHYHCDFEINLVIDTHGKRIVGDSSEDFNELDLVLIGSNVPHAWKGEEKKDCHVVTIQFSDQLINFQIMEKRIFNNIKNMLHESQRGIVFSEKTSRIMKRKILKLTSLQGFQTVLEFFSILNELSISDRRLLASNQFDPQTIVRTTKSRRISKVCEYIKENYSKEITLSDVAGLSNMSAQAFSHFFKRKTNTTFKNFLTNVRITNACRLLSETTDSVAEIGLKCGFNNMANFFRIFKRTKGNTPQEYREIMDQLLIKY